MRAFKLGLWNGNINLFSRKTKKLYRGLIPYLEAFVIDREYDLQDNVSEPENPISLVEVTVFMKSLKFPKKFEMRDYQIEYVAHCIRRPRSVIISPTGSGKSLIIYSLLRWYDKRTLLIVPTIGLVGQMFDDFNEYAAGTPWNSEDMCSKIMGGYSKENLNQVTISTFQSACDMPKEWFDQFEMVVIDEAHKVAAKSITKILESLTDCEIRIGTTGTVDELKVHKFVLEGLLGKVHKIVDTKTLIDQKKLAEINIRCLLLQYSAETKKKIPKSYIEEIQFLSGHHKRNLFIRNLALSLKENTIVMFRYVDSHGKLLYELIKEKAPPGTDVFFIFGGTDADNRNEIRKIVESSKNRCILVASIGTTAIGVNMVNIGNIISASPTKSQIQVLQAIGRGLRRDENNQYFTWFDIADDLSKSKSNKNYTLTHFMQRLKIYSQERFPYKINSIQLEK